MGGKAILQIKVLNNLRDASLICGVYRISHILSDASISPDVDKHLRMPVLAI